MYRVEALQLDNLAPVLVGLELAQQDRRVLVWAQEAVRGLHCS